MEAPGDDDHTHAVGLRLCKKKQTRKTHRKYAPIGGCLELGDLEGQCRERFIMAKEFRGLFLTEGNVLKLPWLCLLLFSRIFFK